MGSLVDALLDGRYIQQFDPRFPGNLGRGFLGDQAYCRFCPGQGSLDIQPALKEILIAEDLPQLVRAVHIFENDRVDYV